VKVAVVRSASDSTEREINLSTDLNLPIIELPSPDSPREVTSFDYLLAYRDSKLILQTTGDAKTGEL
jgi:hypothetical protein